MGQRREPRQEIRLPVRIFGTDANGKVFSENVFTVNVSREGVKLSGVQSQINLNEIIGMTYGQNKGRFSVKWVGKPGSPEAGQIGLLSTTPQKSMWDLPLPAPAIDSYGRSTKATDRREHPRMKCTSSVELHPDGVMSPIWGKALDLSMGGCFVEMQIPLKQGTKLKVGLWVKEQKLWVRGRVASSQPGFGIGIQFAEMSREDAEILRQFLRSISQVPI